MFCNPGKPTEKFPKLKGRAIEVRSEVRGLTAALATTWKHWTDAASVEHQCVLFGFESSALMFE